MKIIEKTIALSVAIVAVGATTISIIQQVKIRKINNKMVKEKEIINTLKKENEVTVSENKTLNDTIKKLFSEREDLIQSLHKQEDLRNRDINNLKLQLNEKDAEIANKTSETLNLQVELDKYKPKEEVNKNARKKKQIKVTSIRQLDKSIKRTLWIITLTTKEEIKKPEIADGYLTIKNNDDESVDITIKRSGNQKHDELRTLIRKCNTVSDIFALHDNNVDSEN